MPLTEREREYFDAFRAEGYGMIEALRAARLRAIQADALDAKIRRDFDKLFDVVERLARMVS